MPISDKKIDEIINRVKNGEKLQKIVINEGISKEDYRAIRIRRRDKKPIEDIKGLPPMRILKKKKALLEEQLKNVSRLIEKIEKAKSDFL